MVMRVLEGRVQGLENADEVPEDAGGRKARTLVRLNAYVKYRYASFPVSLSHAVYLIFSRLLSVDEIKRLRCGFKKAHDFSHGMN